MIALPSDRIPVRVPERQRTTPIRRRRLARRAESGCRPEQPLEVGQPEKRGELEGRKPSEVPFPTRVSAESEQRARCCVLPRPDRPVQRRIAVVIRHIDRGPSCSQLGDEIHFTEYGGEVEGVARLGDNGMLDTHARANESSGNLGVPCEDRCHEWRAPALIRCTGEQRWRMRCDQRIHRRPVTATDRFVQRRRRDRIRLGKRRGFSRFGRVADRFHATDCRRSEDAFSDR